MSNSSLYNIYLSYVAESIPGTTPGTPGMLLLRTPDPLALQAEMEAFTSEEIYTHRQLAMSRNVFKSVGGNIPIELSYQSFDDWLEALLGGSWGSDVLKIGNNIQTFTVERGAADISQYEVFKGVIPNSLSLEIGTGGVVTGSFGVLGMTHEDASDTSLGSPDEVSTNEPFDGLGSATLQEGRESTAIITSISLNINNNRNLGRVLGSNASDAPTNGQVQVEGTLVARFQDEVLLNKFKNGTASSLQVVLNDQNGDDSLTFDLHNVKYNGGNITNNNNTLDVSLPFVAMYDETESTALTITRSATA